MMTLGTAIVDFDMGKTSLQQDLWNCMPVIVPGILPTNIHEQMAYSRRFTLQLHKFVGASMTDLRVRFDGRCAQRASSEVGAGWKVYVLRNMNMFTVTPKVRRWTKEVVLVAGDAIPAVGRHQSLKLNVFLL